MNKYRLREIMDKYQHTYNDVAGILNISKGNFCKKINESGNACFTQNEIIALKELYNLSSSDVDIIFFTKKVS